MEENKNIAEFEVTDLFKSAYHKIALWHNDDATQIGLKQLSHELVEEIAGKVFEHLGIGYDPQIKMSEETRKKLELEKAKFSDIDSL